MPAIQRVSLALAALACTACWEPMPSCEDVPGAADACVKASDLFRYMVPQLGFRAGAGNSAPGDAGVLAPGRRAALAVNLSGGGPVYSPRMGQTASSGTIGRSEYSTDRDAVAAARIDASIGIIPRFRGIVGVDFLASAVRTGSGQLGSLTVERTDPIILGGGIRIGTAPDSTRRRPVFALTLSGTDQGAHAFRVTTPNGGMHVTDMKVSTGAWQLTGGKEFNRIGVNAGLGGGLSSGTATVRGWVDGGASSSMVRVYHDATVTNRFIEGTYRVGKAKLLLGVSQTSWKSEASPMTNSFSPNEESVRSMVMLGARIGS